MPAVNAVPVFLSAGANWSAAITTPEMTYTNNLSTVVTIVPEIGDVGTGPNGSSLFFVTDNQPTPNEEWVYIDNFTFFVDQFHVSGDVVDVDLSTMPGLETIDLSSNSLPVLHIPSGGPLSELNISGNLFDSTNLDIIGNQLLTGFPAFLGGTFDVSGNPGGLDGAIKAALEFAGWIVTI